MGKSMGQPFISVDNFPLILHCGTKYACHKGVKGHEGITASDYRTKLSNRRHDQENPADRVSLNRSSKTGTATELGVQPIHAIYRYCEARKHVLIHNSIKSLDILPGYP